MTMQAFQSPHGSPLDLTAGAIVDGHAGRDLATAARDLSASVLEPGLSRAERISRAERANEARAAMVEWARSVHPYGPASTHTRLRDMVLAAGAEGHSRLAGADEAADRLAIARAADQMTHLTRAGVDLGGLVSRPVAAPIPTPTDTPMVDQLALPVSLEESAADFPGPWTDVPEAVIGWDGAIPTTDTPSLPVVNVPFTVARFATNQSLQALDHSPTFAREQEALWGHIVKAGLERELVGVLATAATAADSWTAAEVAIGAVWSGGADVVLCAGADLPKVRRAYAADFPNPVDRPTIHGTLGLPAGTALVLAYAGIAAEATPLQWLMATAPAHLGREISVYLQGRVLIRLPGAVQKVTVA